MAWGVLAIAVVGLIVLVRGLGFASLSARWLEEEGKPRLARRIRTWTALLWTGVFAGFLGGLWRTRSLMWIGVALVVAATGVLVSASERTRRNERPSTSRKQPV